MSSTGAFWWTEGRNASDRVLAHFLRPVPPDRDAIGRFAIDDREIDDWVDISFGFEITDHISELAAARYRHCTGTLAHAEALDPPSP